MFRYCEVRENFVKYWGGSIIRSFCQDFCLETDSCVFIYIDV